MNFILAKQTTVAGNILAELRDVSIQTDRLRFRHNMHRIGEILAYEISKTLRYKNAEVDTPLGTAEHQVLEDRIVLGTILRAGLPFHEGMLHFFDKADNAFISAFRKEHKDGSLEVQLDYVSSAQLDDSVLILCDPMLATGSSVLLSLERLLDQGTPREIHIASIIASVAGVEAVSRMYPKAKIWLGDIDEELTAKSYIVPGLGDAGDLAFGEKS